MDKKLFTLNVVFAVVDLIFSALTVLVVTWAANHFGKLWIMLFLIIPVVLFNNRTMVINNDIRQAKVDQLKPGSDNDGET